jgi:hypothetical protein
MRSESGVVMIERHQNSAERSLFTAGAALPNWS